jgi:hypothetical protein
MAVRFRCGRTSATASNNADTGKSKAPRVVPGADTPYAAPGAAHLSAGRRKHVRQKNKEKEVALPDGSSDDEEAEGEALEGGGDEGQAKRSRRSLRTINPSDMHYTAPEHWVDHFFPDDGVPNWPLVAKELLSVRACQWDSITIPCIHRYQEHLLRRLTLIAHLHVCADLFTSRVWPGGCVGPHT